MKSFGISILVSVFLVGFSAATANVLGDVLDQSNALTRFGSDAGVGFTNSSNVAQTVHVGVTGQLSRIEFWAHRSGNEIGDLVLDIRPVDINLQPAENTILGQVTIPRLSIPIFTQPVDVSHYVMSVDLTSLNLNFQAGDYFAFNFSNTNGGGGTAGTAFGIMGDFAPAPGPYVLGQAYFRRTDLNNNHNFLWTDGFPDPTVPGPTWVDLGFRTFMLGQVPEPSTLLLLGIGAISLLGYRKAKSHG